MIAKTSLGIDGWALHEFGLTGDVSPVSSGAVPSGTADSVADVFGPPDSRQSEWDSEFELSDLERMEGASEWEADNINDT